MPISNIFITLILVTCGLYYLQWYAESNALYIKWT